MGHEAVYDFGGQVVTRDCFVITAASTSRLFGASTPLTERRMDRRPNTLYNNLCERAIYRPYDPPDRSVRLLGPPSGRSACAHHRGSPHEWGVPMRTQYLLPNIQTLTLGVLCVYPGPRALPPWYAHHPGTYPCTRVYQGNCMHGSR